MVMFELKMVLFERVTALTSAPFRIIHLALASFCCDPTA
jgi:succinate dehydrogenase hydrophobic anchor subunit